MSEATKRAVKAWRKRNPERERALDRQYKQLRRGVRGWLFERVLLVYGTKCLRCGKRKKLCGDHVIPLNLGGENHPRNIQPLCAACNTARGSSQTERSMDYRPDKGERIVGMAESWERQMRRDGLWAQVMRGRLISASKMRGKR